MALEKALSELRRCPGPPAPHGRHADVALAVVHSPPQDPHHLTLKWMQQRVWHLHHILQHSHCSASRCQQRWSRHGMQQEPLHCVEDLWELSATRMQDGKYHLQQVDSKDRRGHIKLLAFASMWISDDKYLNVHRAESVAEARCQP